MRQNKYVDEQGIVVVEDIPEIDLLILDVDGVLTSGKKVYDSSGLAKFKEFCDKDFTAIKRFKASGVKVCFLSGDSNVNESIARNRNIDFYCSRIDNVMVDKTEFISQFEQTYNTKKEFMAYVGDDIFDTTIMREVGYAYCPRNVPRDVKDVCKVLDVNCGEDVVAFLYDYMVEKSMISKCKLSDVVNLDKLESF